MINKKYGVILFGILIGIAILAVLSFMSNANYKNTSVENSGMQLEEFTSAELALYDGTDTTKRILVGLDGMVYDVTSGKEYYQKGGSYNWLVGKDSSKELNLIGGEIIKKKYPIVGKLVQ